MQLTSQRDFWPIRLELSQTAPFKDRVLIVAVKVAHEVMNTDTTEKNIKLKMKCVELLNTPESFKDRLALSVAALLPPEFFTEVRDRSDYGDLGAVVIDVLDAIAGQGI